MRIDQDPGFEPVPDDARPDVAELPAFATAEEVAYAEEQLRLDRAEDAALRAQWQASGFDVEESEWDDAAAGLPATSDDNVVERLMGPAGGADLMLLESIDPRSLDEPAKVRYVQACDRVSASVAAHRAAAVVALAGTTSSRAYLPEVHLEHEIAVARRTSRYSAGKAIETARALATTFPGFAAALRAGEVSEAHCAILVERTRVVTDPETLARIESRVLPKARRMTPASSPARSRRRSRCSTATPPPGSAGPGRPAGSGCVSSPTGWATSG
jgi:hypothetical protein